MRDKPQAKPNRPSDQFIGGPEAMSKVRKANRQDTVIFLCIMIPVITLLTYVAYLKTTMPSSQLPCSNWSDVVISAVPARCYSYFGLK